MQKSKSVEIISFKEVLHNLRWALSVQKHHASYNLKFVENKSTCVRWLKFNFEFSKYEVGKILYIVTYFGDKRTMHDYQKYITVLSMYY